MGAPSAAQIMGLTPRKADPGSGGGPLEHRIAFESPFPSTVAGPEEWDSKGVTQHRVWPLGDPDVGTAESGELDELERVLTAQRRPVDEKGEKCSAVTQDCCVDLMFAVSKMIGDENAGDVCPLGDSLRAILGQPSVSQLGLGGVQDALVGVRCLFIVSRRHCAPLQWQNPLNWSDVEGLSTSSRRSMDGCLVTANQGQSRGVLRTFLVPTSWPNPGEGRALLAPGTSGPMPFFRAALDERV